VRRGLEDARVNGTLSQEEVEKRLPAHGSPSSLVERPDLRDRETIASFIAADSPAYAPVVAKNVRNQVRTLAQFPRIGRKVPEFDDEDSACSTAIASFIDCRAKAL
jgi:plasmid stabilization system protein ParE